MRTPLLLATAVVLSFAPVSARADNAPAPSAATSAAPAAMSNSSRVFSDAQRHEIENIIKQYLTKDHPETIMEAAQELQKRDNAEAETKSSEAIGKNRDKLYNDPNTPTAGDPKGDVTVVEFFDYQCGYCKMAEPGIEKLLKEDKKVRFVFKEFPILGPGSLDAAKISIASMKQGKFLQFHEALINKKDHISDALIAEAIKEAGLDADKVKKDAADPSVQKIIEESTTLGTDIGVRGTPMFIINDQVYPGAMQYEQLKQAVDEARKNAKKS